MKKFCMLLLLALTLISGSVYASYLCMVENNMGISFYGNGMDFWTAKTRAMRHCQMNTPFGMVCYDMGCGYQYDGLNF